MRYTVVAGYVTVETAVPGGRAQIDIPRGASLPDDVPEEQVAILLRLGDIEATGQEAAEPGPLERPGVRASKAEWVDYAVGVGLDRGEADAMTKAELIDSLGE